MKNRQKQDRKLRTLETRELGRVTGGFGAPPDGTPMPAARKGDDGTPLPALLDDGTPMPA